MTNLDPKLQSAMTELVEHQNRQYRFAWKYGIWIALVMFAIFGAGMYWMWASHQRSVQEMDERYEQGVDDMRQRHQQRVEEMRLHRERMLQDQLPPQGR